MILISDIEDMGCNLNYSGWKGNWAPISEMPNLRHLVYVAVAATRYQSFLCMQGGHKMPPHRAHSYIQTVTQHGGGEGGSSKERWRTAERALRRWVHDTGLQSD